MYSRPNKYQGNKQYILFTWSKCKQCAELKRYSPQISSRGVTQYDLDNISGDQNLWRVFQAISPKSQVPALALINNGMLEKGVVGLSPVMKAIGL